VVSLVTVAMSQYSGYSQSGQLKVKLLLKGNACGSSNAMAAKLLSGYKTLGVSYAISNATIVESAPPEKTCSTPPADQLLPSSNSTEPTQPNIPPSDVPTTTTVSVFTQQSYKTDIEVSAVGMEKLRFIITAHHSGMVGIGFPSVPRIMLESDAIIGWGSSQLVPSSIADYTIGKERSEDCNAGGVCKDWEQNLERTEVSEANGITTLKFIRRRITTDNMDAKLVNPGQLQNINIALGESYGLSYHGTKKTSTTFVMPAGIEGGSDEIEPIQPSTQPPTQPQSPMSSELLQPSEAGLLQFDATSTILTIVCVIIAIIVSILGITLCVRSKKGNGERAWRQFDKL